MQSSKSNEMGQIKLKAEIKDLIKTDHDLYARVAAAAGVAPMSLPRLLRGDSQKLTQVEVLRVVAEKLECESSDLFEENQVA